MTNQELLELLLEWIRQSIDQGCPQEAAKIWKTVEHVLKTLGVNIIFDKSKPHQTLSDIVHHQIPNMIECACSSPQFKEKFIMILYKYLDVEFMSELEGASDPNMLKFENNQKSLVVLRLILRLILKQIESHSQIVLPHFKNTKLLSILQFTIDLNCDAKSYKETIDNHKDLVSRLIFNLSLSKDQLIKEHGGNFDFLLSTALISYLEAFLAYHDKSINEDRKQDINKFLQKLQGSMVASALPSVQAHLISSMQRFGVLPSPTSLPHKTAGGAIPPRLFEIPAAAEITAIQAQYPTLIEKINEVLGPDYVNGFNEKKLYWLPEGTKLTLQGKALAFDQVDTEKAEKQKQAVIRRLSRVGISEAQIKFEPFPREPHKVRLILINLDNIYLNHSRELINKPAAGDPPGKRERRESLNNVYHLKIFF